MAYASQQNGELLMEDPFEEAELLHERHAFPEAFAAFLLLAEEGDTSAMTRLALMLTLGEGVTKDLATAMDWERRAANAGDVMALYNLAISYRLRGDCLSAKHWFQRALDAGEGDAALQLAQMSMPGGCLSEPVKPLLRTALASPSLTKASREAATFLLRRIAEE
jgi:uncharacterized protein